MEESVEGPRFSVQQHNQVMSVLFKRPAGNLESRGGCEQQASTQKMFVVWKVPFKCVPDIQMKKMEMLRWREYVQEDKLALKKINK